MAAIEASRRDSDPASSNPTQSPSNTGKAKGEGANISKKRVKTSTATPTKSSRYKKDVNTHHSDAAEVHQDNDTVMADLGVETATSPGPATSRRSRKRGAPTQRNDGPAPSSSAAKASQKEGEDDSAHDTDSPMAGTGDNTVSEKGSREESAPATTEEAPRRSGRRSTRKTYQEEDSDADFAPAPTPPQPEGKMPLTSRGGNSRIWKPDYLLQDPKSKLAKADVSAILKDPRAWNSLSPTQQSIIISLLPNVPALAPDPADPTASLPNIPQQMLSCNDAFRADISMFQFDLSEGRLEPDWQHDGLVAMERRARGEFDEWKEKEVEAFWGQKQKLSYDVIAGESSKVKLEELIAAGCWKVGDVWVYTRSFGRGKNAVTIEKEATITSITEDNRIAFRLPDGQRKFSSGTAGEDVETEPLDGLQPLADKVIETDGRIGSWRAVNAWKEIRCFRKNQDIGSPWEIREIYWARQQGSDAA
ncbi:hypothetical protein SLS58_006113 [Diplodia intermedia]|uniref:DEUBAD domain-containing protein n=1 Tax=Diplodia intermedia TaxID=856260 RepID=A0ABR3TPA3_9PEZI